MSLGLFDDGKENEESLGKELPLGLIFVAIIFLLNGLYLLFLFLGSVGRHWGDMISMAIIFSYVLLAFYHIASFVGVLKRRRFALVSGSILLAYNVFSGIILFVPVAMPSIVISLIAFYLLMRNSDHFEDFGGIDRKILIGMFLLIPLYFTGWAYVANLPTPEEIYHQVSAEAIEKGDWRVCERLDLGWESECIMNFAVNKKDPELCKNVPINDDRYRCYIAIASALKDRSICDMLDDAIIEEGLKYGDNKTELCKGLV